MSCATCRHMNTFLKMWGVYIPIEVRAAIGERKACTVWESLPTWETVGKDGEKACGRAWGTPYQVKEEALQLLQKAARLSRTSQSTTSTASSHTGKTAGDAVRFQVAGQKA